MFVRRELALCDEKYKYFLSREPPLTYTIELDSERDLERDRSPLPCRQRGGSTWPSEICFDSLIAEGSHKVYSLVIDRCASHVKAEEIQQEIDR